MPWNLIWHPHGVHIRYQGHLRVGELIASTEAVHGDARFDELRYRINDLLEVTGFDLADAPGEVEELAAITYAASHSGLRRLREGLVAHVAVNPAVRAMVERYVAHDETHYGRAVFATVDEARHWIAQTLAQTQRRARTPGGIKPPASASPPTAPATSPRDAES